MDKGRSRYLVNVGTVGHVDHGKTTLTPAITNVLARVYGGQAQDFAAQSYITPPDKKRKPARHLASYKRDNAHLSKLSSQRFRHQNTNRK